MFKLPELGYSYDAIEPYIDSKTMEIHHTKHHGAYTANLNAVIEKYPEIRYKDDVAFLLKNIHIYPKEYQSIIRNNAGGYANHCLYFRILKPGYNEDNIEKNFKEDVNNIFGTIQNMKEQLKANALKVFGSGWAWLVFKDKLEIITTPNQDSPLMEDYKPIIGVDVWEHAYYLKYQNRRSDYIEAFFQALNLEEVSKVYNEVI